MLMFGSPTPMTHIFYLLLRVMTWDLIRFLYNFRCQMKDIVSEEVKGLFAVYIYFWSFEIGVNILRNQKYMIGLDSYSRQILNYFKVFESTAYLKFAKLQYVTSGFRCRVFTESLMRLYKPKLRLV